MDFLSAQREGSGDAGPVGLSENAHGELRAPRAHQAVNAHHFPFMYIEGYVIHDFSLRIERMIYGPVLHFHIDIADLHIVAFRETVRDLTAYHPLDDSIF